MAAAGAAVGGGGTVIGAVMQGIAMKQQAKQTESQVKLTRVETAAAERKSRAESSRALAAARTQVGASGAGLEGSPLEVLAENAKQAELEALNIRYTGEAKRLALEQQAKWLKKMGDILSSGKAFNISKKSMPWTSSGFPIKSK